MPVPAPDRSLRIEEIRAKDLPEFAACHFEDGLRGQVVPISRMRAAAHAANPYADPDDVLLLVAMRGEECVGYAGLMPGILRVGDRVHKVFWYTTWYGRPDTEQQNVGGMLLLASLAVKVDILGADLAPETFEYYRRARFQPLGPLPYWEMNFDRLDPLGAPWLLLRRLLRRQGRRLKALDAIFRACRSLTKALGHRLIGRAAARICRDFDFLEIPELVPDAERRDRRPVARLGRDAKLVRWALRYPWVTDDPEKATRGYVFSDYRALARFFVLEVRERRQEESLGHVVVSVCRNEERTTVKVLDHFLEPYGNARVLLAAALTYARRYRADRVLVPEQCGTHLKRSLLLPWLFREKHRFYFCRPRRRDSALAPVLDRLELGFCDGDTPFT